MLKSVYSATPELKDIHVFPGAHLACQACVKVMSRCAFNPGMAGLLVGDLSVSI